MPINRSVYGSIDSLRLPEEIAVWKAWERDNASAIRSAISGLEPVYAHWLADWERVFEHTRNYAVRLKMAIDERKDEEGLNGEDELCSGLLETALNQSREFGRQLTLLRQHSEALKSAQPSHQVFAYLERQSEFGEETLRHLGLEGGNGQFPPQRQSSEEEPEGYGGPEPADGMAGIQPRNEQEGTIPRPETWSDPLGKLDSSPGNPVPIGGHTLPPLPYKYNALEPYIDEKTMRIHHDKHHQSYVDGLNAAEKKLEEARKTGNFELVKHWERELAFNGAGHYLHTLFWNVMSPKGGGKPSGALLEEINRSFGSYDAFKKQFTEAANKVEGGGWAILVWSPRSHRLEILTAEKHQNLSQWDVVPLLPLDVWEHAYYLKHQNDRAAYVKDWWNVVNWPYVADRFARARTLKWVPY